MFTHTEIWTALDRLAMAHNYSTSGLAKKAGLDATTFNKSKRITPDGKPRWPSTESIAKSLAATESTLSDLIGFIEDKPFAPPSNDAISLDHYDLSKNEMKRLNQKPLASLINVPDQSIAITLNTPQWAPRYKKGSTIIVTPVTSFEIDDILLIETRDSQFFIMAIDKEEDDYVFLRALVLSDPDRRIDKADIVKTSKILWASQ